MKHFDVLIVGRGVLGLSTAFALHQADPALTIGVIGQKEQLGGGSIAAGAMLGCFGEVTQDTLNQPHHKTKFNISLRAKAYWPQWLRQLNQATSNTKVDAQYGTSIVHNTESGFLENNNYRAIIDALNQYQEPYHYVPPSDISGLKPVANRRPLEAIYLTEEGFINPNSLIEAFDDWMEQCANVKTLNQQATQLIHQHHQVKGIQLFNSETYYGNHVVLACGAFSQHFIDQVAELNQNIPRLFYGIGNAVLLNYNQSSPIHHVIRTPNRSFACGLHVVPRNETQLYVGATNNIMTMPEYEPRLSLTNFVASCFLEQFNRQSHSAKVAGWAVGHRPVCLDTFPLIGSTSLKGLWLLTGTYRDGLQQSPILAYELAQAILGNSITPEIERFQPERLLLNSYTKEQAIESGVEHYLAGAYEHQMYMPKVGWDDMFRTMMRYKVESIYNQLPDDFILPPDFLLLFDEESDAMSLIQNAIESNIQSRKTTFPI